MALGYGFLLGYISVCDIMLTLTKSPAAEDIKRAVCPSSIFIILPSLNLLHTSTQTVTTKSLPFELSQTPSLLDHYL